MIAPIIKCCAGLDVHREIIVCTVLKELDDEGIQKHLRECSSFRHDLKSLAEWLRSLDVELAVMESTGIYWKSVYETLEDEEIETYVVNACHIKNVPGRKTDVKDSEWLAELARCGLLKASFVPSRDFRELRMLTRYRRKLAGCLCGEKNRLHKVLDDSGIRLGCVVSDIDGVSARRIISALVEQDKSPDELAKLALGALRKKEEEIRLSLDGRLSDRHRFLLKRIQKHMEFLQQDIHEIDVQIVAAMQPYQEEWQLLQTIPGVDQISAAMLLAEVGTDMSQFSNKDHFSSWAGMCPGNNESAGKRKSSRIGKGNKHIRSLLCEIANGAVKSNCQFKGLHQSFAIRRGRKRAIVAVGHKILKIIFAVLRSKQPYRDPGMDYQALIVKRNAPRWLQSLKKFGYLPAEPTEPAD